MVSFVAHKIELSTQGSALFVGETRGEYLSTLQTNTHVTPLQLQGNENRLGEIAEKSLRRALTDALSVV